MCDLRGKKKETATRTIVQSQANKFLLALLMFQLPESLRSFSSVLQQRKGFQELLTQKHFQY